MSDCDPLRVHALHDGTLGAESREEALHATQCAECTAALAELRALDALARQEPEVPAGYFESLPARIVARAARRSRPAWSRPATWASALAAILLIAVVTPRLLDRSRPEPERREPTRAAPTASAVTRQQPEAAVAPAPAVGDLARPQLRAAPEARSVPSAKTEASDALAIRDEARHDKATAAPEPSAVRERLAAPAPAAPAGIAPEPAAPATMAEQEGQATSDAAGTAPRAMPKTAAARTTGFAAAGPPAAELARARAEREDRVREAQRPGANAAAQRRAFEAAAAVVRLGGDEADRVVLRERARLYRATTSDPAERQWVQATLQELDPR